MQGFRESDDVKIVRQHQIQYVVGLLVDGTDVKNAEMKLALVGDCSAACVGGEGAFLCPGIGCTTMDVRVDFQQSLVYGRSR